MISPIEIHRQAARDQVKEQIVEKDYALTWFLLALSEIPKIHKVWLFKGGTCIRKMYFPNWRYSEDLDFTLAKNFERDEIADMLDQISEVAGRLSGMTFRIASIEGNVIYVEYIGPLQKVAGLRKFKVDLTSDEILVDHSVHKKIMGLFSDQKGKHKELPVYSLEEICAEKARSLIQRREPRDLYDIWRLLSDDQSIDRSKIADIFKKKCEFKKLKPIGLQHVIGNHNSSTLERMWEHRLGEQMVDLPHFDQVIRETKRLLRTG